MKKSIFFLVSCLFVVTSATAQIGLIGGFAQIGQGIGLGTTTAFMSQWQNSYQYENIITATDYVYDAGSNATYVLVSSGTCTSAATGAGPTGTGTGITDGSCTWNYVQGGSQIFVPANYVATVSVEAIGGGGGGSNGSNIAFTGDLASGGGGAYAKITNFSTSPGATVFYSAGLAGVGGAANGSTLNPGTNAQAAIFGGTASSFGTCTAAAAVSAPLCADFGVGGNTTGGTGGLAANSIGNVTFNGGSSGTMSNDAAPGGGGAGGPHGAGASGGNGSAVAFPAVAPGSGGGGADGGSVGLIGSSSTGGNGGTNFASSGAGIGTTAAGGSGTNGGGGAGSGTTGNAGNGGCGTNFDTLHGPGGGGGGATANASALAGNGACGGGGASTAPGSPLNGGNGGNGLIAFKYQYCSFNCGAGNGGIGPAISSLAVSPSSGTVTTGTVTFTVGFNSAVVVSGGTPTLNLNTAVPSAATYSSGSRTNQLIFTTTPTSGQTANPVGTTTSAISLNGATIQSSGTNVNLTDANSQTFFGLAFAPTGGGGGGSATVASIVPSTSSGLLIAGSTETFTVNFTSAVTVTGTPTLALNNGGTASYTGGSGTSALTFGYTVTSGQNTPIAASPTNTSGNTYLGTTSSALSGTISGTSSLAGANSLIFTGLAANTNALYFVSPTGTDTGSGTGACSHGSPCATLNFVRGLMEANSTKTVYLLPGTYTPSTTCTFQTTNQNINGQNTANGVICLALTSDNGTSYLGYPNSSGPLGVIVTGGATSASNGQQAFAEAGFDLNGGGFGNCATGPSNITFNGFTIKNFAWEGIHLNCTGGVITVSNMAIGNLFQVDPSESGCCNEGGGGIATLGGWKQIYIAHNFLWNIGNEGILGPVSDNSANGFGQSAGGYYIADGNILVNNCSGTFDCGPLYGRDASITLANGAWTNNIVSGAGSDSLVDVCLYEDDYDSNMTITGNQVSGCGFMAVLIHGGRSNTYQNNVFDMSTTYTSNGTNNADVLYYQDNNIYQGSGEFPCPGWNSGSPTTSGCLVNGYGGTMDTNVLTGNIYYTTVAPPGTSCNGFVGCGYAYVWEAADWAHPSATKNPNVNGNNWWYTGGTWSSIAQFKSSPSQSSSTFGQISDASAITSNPGISTATKTYNGINYTIYTVANPPAGWTALRTDQGPH